MDRTGSVPESEAGGCARSGQRRTPRAAIVHKSRRQVIGQAGDGTTETDVGRATECGMMAYHVARVRSAIWTDRENFVLQQTWR